MSGGTYNLTSTLNNRFLRNFCMTGLLLSEILPEICWKEIAKDILFFILRFDAWRGIRTRSLSLINQHATKWARHLTFFFFQLVLISWMVTLSSCLIWQIISFILPPNKYGCVYAWKTLGNIATDRLTENADFSLFSYIFKYLIFKRFLESTLIKVLYCLNQFSQPSILFFLISYHGILPAKTIKCHMLYIPYSWSINKMFENYNFFSDWYFLVRYVCWKNQ